MRRILCTFALFCLTAVPAAAQDASPQARVDQVDTAHYPDVTLYVSVTDSAGHPVSGLNQNDFTITEDGQPVTISGFDGGAGPISTVLIFDRSGSMADAGKLDGAQAAARAFVDQMRPGDQ